jgi:enamine deaminase RidA (YjgF/YER057c/UK114 family)
MAEIKKISSGSLFEEKVSFSRAVVVENWVFVSGCTGYDYKENVLKEGIEAQTEQTFKNIEFALNEAGTDFNHVVKVVYYIANPDEFEATWPVIKKYFGYILPACTAICSPLVNPNIKIEIEVTAILPTKN